MSVDEPKAGLRRTHSDGRNEVPSEAVSKDRIRLGFLTRRHTESTFSSVRPTPEEAAKWSISFGDLMSSKYGQSLFKAFLRREFSDENIEFWLAVEEFHKTKASKLGAKAATIFADFIQPHATKQVNLDSATRLVLQSKLTSPTHAMFDGVQRHIQSILEVDAYPRFLNSDLYLELLYPERYPAVPPDPEPKCES